MLRVTVGPRVPGYISADFLFGVDGNGLSVFRAGVTPLGAALCLCLEEDSFSGLDLTRYDLTR